MKQIRCTEIPEGGSARANRGFPAGPRYQLSVANMLDFAPLGDSQFDAVICMDSALPHLESAQQLVQAAEQMRARTASGGVVMASIRDYDHLIEERAVVQGPAFYSDRGRRRIIFQVGTGSTTDDIFFTFTSLESWRMNGRRFTQPLLIAPSAEMRSRPHLVKQDLRIHAGYSLPRVAFISP
jgi:hypothetical protein